MFAEKTGALEAPRENTKEIGLYIHWPFCASKCPYCDFNSHVTQSIDHERWRQAYVRALTHYQALVPEARIVSVFFGGGTPSLMEPKTAEAILSCVQDQWAIDPDWEVTLEANPTSVEIDKFKDFRAAGINRVSIGVQALNDTDLKFLGREHDAAEAVRAIKTAADIFERYSFDLMYGRPGQTLNDWKRELMQAIDFSCDHMSLYQLTIERNTPFHNMYVRGDFSIPNEVLGADFYHLTQDVLGAAGLPAYEVSNHAGPGQESRHNMIYWRYGDYIGLGPGAHGRLNLDGCKVATREHRMPDIWLRDVEERGHGLHPFEPLSSRDRFQEGLMMGLRLREGLDLHKLEEETASDLDEFVNRNKLKILTEQGWAVNEGKHIRLTTEGMLRLNAILSFITR